MYVHGAKTIKLYSAGKGGGRSKNLVQGPTLIDCLLLILFSFIFQQNLAAEVEGVPGLPCVEMGFYADISRE